ncbi:MAG: hypothetical protein H0S82_09290, partial [Anaerolineaceae bacterium]|nr:hypothetical protein [Anaerolineaceae bacterium]
MRWKNGTVIFILMLLILTACTTVGTGVPNPYLETPNGTTTSQIESLLEGDFLTETPQTSATHEPGFTPSPTATQVPATYYFFDDGIDPLTGLAASEANLDRRPVL